MFEQYGISNQLHLEFMLSFLKFKYRVLAKFDLVLGQELDASLFGLLGLLFLAKFECFIDLAAQ